MAKLVSRMNRFVLKVSKKRFAIILGTLQGGYRGFSDADRVYSIDPRAIVYCTSREFPVFDFKGNVVAGDWDLPEKKFEDIDIYAAFREVMVEGKKWSETIFYQRIAYMLERGNILWGCKNKKELDQRCRKLEHLYRTIQADGYRSQNEIHTPWLGRYNLWGDEEIGVSIGRHGDLLYCDGAHRLAIAKLLGLPTVPVEVVVRHPEWFHFRKSLLQYVKRHKGVLDQPLLHSDLAHLPVRWDCEAIFSLIKNNLPATHGLLLDVGAQFGFFCHRFESEGLDCIALEDSEDDLYFLEHLRKAGNKEFRIVKGGKENEVINYHFDAVLARDLPDHSGDMKGPTKRTDFLEKLHTDELFLLGRQNKLPPVRMKGSSRFKEWKCLGVLENSLAVYRLSANKS
jgi:hypothetical protein